MQEPKQLSVRKNDAKRIGTERLLHTHIHKHTEVPRRQGHYGAFEPLPSEHKVQPDATVARAVEKGQLTRATIRFLLRVVLPRGTHCAIVQHSMESHLLAAIGQQQSNG